MASFDYTFASGDTVTPTKLNAARNVKDIVNADISATAAIAGAKITPNFGSQNVVTTGNVAIGTSSAQDSLHIAGTAAIVRLQDADTVANGSNALATFVRFSDSNNTEAGYVGFGGGPNFDLYNSTNSSMLFWTNNTERVRIASGGNVGINVANPTEKLDVGGTVKATAFSGPLTGDVIGNVTGDVTGDVTGNVTGNLAGTASAVADGSVSTSKIVDANVTTAKIADANVTTAKIADGAVTLAKLVTAVQESLLPAGAVQAFAMNSAPAGWLAADGSNVNRTTYAALFSAISTTYGAGDGSTTFAVPDLRGYFVRGSGTNSDGTAAGAFGEKQADEFKAHTHLGTTHVGLGASGGTLFVGASGTSGSTGGTETRPKNIAMLYCIKF